MHTKWIQIFHITDCNFIAKIIRPTVRSRIRMVSSRFTGADIMGAKRDAVEMELKNELERIFYSRGIFVENVLLSEIANVQEYTRTAAE